MKKLIKQILKESPSKYTDLIEHSIKFADEKLDGEKRLSGEYLVEHSLKTALTLAQLSCDTNTIVAGILHSCFAKDIAIQEEIKKEFGKDIYTLIFKAKQISKVTASTRTESEIITKCILNASTDLRPILIKLASAAQNVETLEYLPEDVRKGKIKKAFEIYGKIAEYLNLGKLKKEIEENAFKRYKLEEFERISKLLESHEINQELLQKYTRHFKKIFKNVPNIQIECRIKSKYSIYNKLKKYEKEWINPELGRIEDLIGFRVVTDTEEQCFTVLERVMDSGELDYTSFDDYISNPKPNGYSAMQGTVVFPKISSNKIELQILTQDMHYTNTYGTASHIAYKASQSRFAKPDTSYDWVECIHKQFTRHQRLRNEKQSIPIRCKIFENEKFVMTPKGQIIDLDINDTVLDFAFRVHSEIGHSAVAAKMENKAIPLSYIPKTGDVIQIVTQKGKTKQKEDILKLANSPSTRAKILRRLGK
jgi:GTP pyrophosphokinase